MVVPWRTCSTSHAPPYLNQPCSKQYTFGSREGRGHDKHILDSNRCFLPLPMFVEFVHGSEHCFQLQTWFEHDCSGRGFLKSCWTKAHPVQPRIATSALQPVISQRTSFIGKGTCHLPNFSGNDYLSKVMPTTGDLTKHLRRTRTPMSPGITPNEKTYGSPSATTYSLKGESINRSLQVFIVDWCLLTPHASDITHPTPSFDTRLSQTEREPRTVSFLTRWDWKSYCRLEAKD